MSQEILNLFSIQRQLSDTENGLGISDETLSFLSCKAFHTQLLVASREIKLSWLSIWRNVFGRLKLLRKENVIEPGFAGRLKDFIVDGEDPLVVYGAQKTFVTMMNYENMDDGLSLIVDVLGTCSCIQTLTYYLEMCKYLLSKQNPNCCALLSKIYPVLHCASDMYKSNKEITDQFLYQFVAIFHKVLKLNNIYQTRETYRPICEIYLRRSSMLLDILFNTGAEKFVKRKLCLTLYYLVKPGSNLLENDIKKCSVAFQDVALDNQLTEFAEHYAEKLSAVGMETVFVRYDQTTGFAGDECLEKGEKSVVDKVHLREWCVLSLGMTSILWRGTESNHEMATNLLLKLDTCVKEATGLKDTRILFPWLPEIFADQDDMWIDALLMLLELVSRLDRLSLDHHWYFLQFLRTVAYDHSVLIDLLTSPETCFLDYFTRYLKYVLKTWLAFVESVVKFEKDNTSRDIWIDSDIFVEDSDSDDDREVEAKIECDFNIVGEDIDNVINDEMEHDHIICGTEMDNMNIRNDIDKVHVKTCTEIKAVNDNSIKACQMNASEQECDDASDENVCKTDSVDQTSKWSGDKHSGLGMIMGAYSDSDDDVDDVDDSSSVTIDSELYRLHDSSGQNNILPNSTHNLNEAIISGNISNLSGSQVTKSELSCDVIKVEDSELDIYGNAHQNEKEIDKIVEDDNNSDTDLCKAKSFIDSETVNIKMEQNNLIDKVIAVFIRVALKLQRMWTHNLMTYDPKALLKLLDEVEVLYVQMEK